MKTFKDYLKEENNNEKHYYLVFAYGAENHVELIRGSFISKYSGVQYEPYGDKVPFVVHSNDFIIEVDKKTYNEYLNDNEDNYDNIDDYIQHYLNQEL